MNLLDERIKRLKNRRDMLTDGLNSLSGISCKPADGAMFLFADIRETGMTSNEFVNFIMENCGVVALPGNVFGENGEGFFRISFGRSEELILKAIENMKKVF